MQDNKYMIKALKTGIKADLIKLFEDIYTLSTVLTQLNHNIEEITSPETIQKIALKRGSEETAKWLVYRYVNTVDLLVNFIYEHLNDLLDLIKEYRNKSKEIPINDSLIESLKKAQYLIAVDSKVTKVPPGYTITKEESLPDLTLNAHENSYKTLLKWIPDEDTKYYVEESYSLYELVKTLAYEIGSIAMKLINKIAVLKATEASKDIENYIGKVKSKTSKEFEKELSSEEMSIEEIANEIENMQSESGGEMTNLPFEEEE